MISLFNLTIVNILKVGKTKKKGADDFDLLNQALKAAPLTKAQKEAEAKKKAAEEQRKKEEDARVAKEARAKVQTSPHQSLRLSQFRPSEMQ